MAAERRGTTSGPAGDIAWRTLGTGPPLLVLNGYAATKDDWDPTFLQAVGSFATLVCPDNRAIGESTGPTATLTVEDMAADALAVLDDHGIDRAPVLGWSMGGFVAQTLAAAEPGRVDALVLLSTDPGGAEAIARTDDVHQRLTDHTGEPLEQARRLLDLLFPPAVAGPLFDQFGPAVADARAQLDPAVLTAQEQAMARWYEAASAERRAALRLPVLAACGSEDVVIPPANTDALAELPGPAWTAHFEGGGHAFMAQEPTRLARLVGAFLDAPQPSAA